MSQLPNKTVDAPLVSRLMQPYLPIVGLDIPTWLKNDSNACLINENHDLAFFEKISEQVYEGHYFFKSRGKQALEKAKAFLTYFIEAYQPRVIKGLTPLENLGARWLSRKLGFRGYGVVQTVVGPCELFILTKEDWENRINE